MQLRVMRCSRTFVAAAMVLATVATGVEAAAVKPKPVIGQLVIAGTTSQVAAFSWVVTADTSWTKGSGASVGHPVPTAIQFTKLLDSSSIPTLLKITQGSSFPTAVFTTTLGKGNTASTMVYEMENLFVTNVTESAADGLVTEDVSFVFKKVTWTFTDASGNVTTGSWDVTPTS